MNLLLDNLFIHKKFIIFNMNKIKPIGLRTHINVEGQIVYKKNIQNVDNQLFMDIDMSTQPNGLYFIHVKNNEFFMNKKIVKQ